MCLYYQGCVSSISQAPGHVLTWVDFHLTFAAVLGDSPHFTDEDTEVQRIVLRQAPLVLMAFHFPAFRPDSRLAAPESFCLRVCSGSWLILSTSVLGRSVTGVGLNVPHSQSRSSPQPVRDGSWLENASFIDRLLLCLTLQLSPSVPGSRLDGTICTSASGLGPASGRFPNNCPRSSLNATAFYVFILPVAFDTTDGLSYFENFPFLGSVTPGRIVFVLVATFLSCSLVLLFPLVARF